MASQCTIAIDVGERLLRAVEVRFERGVTRVMRSVAAPFPADVSQDNVDAIGRFVSETLRRGGFPGAGDAIVVLERDQASIRRLELPTDDPTELPEMARLAAQRETPTEAGPLVVDVISREQLDSSMMALATTAPDRSVARLVSIINSAGYKTKQCTLRTFGTARLLRDIEHEGTWTVGIDCAGDAVDLVITRDGDVRSSRGVRIDQESLGVEVKRSWSGWRLGQPDETIGAAVVFGSEDDRATILEALGRTIGPPIAIFEPSSEVRIDPGVDRKALDRAWPLVGLLIEAGAGEETINLVAPRKAPDLAARRRVRVLAGIAVVIIGTGLGWIGGRQSWNGFVAHVKLKKEEAATSRPKHQGYKRDQARLMHLAKWESARPAWLEHLRFLNEFAADPSNVVLDDWTGTLDASDVKFDGRTSKWTISHEIKIMLQGEAKDRTIADAFRDALVDDARYELTSTGPDTEGGRRLKSPFSYVLRTSDPKAPGPRGETKKPEPAKPDAKSTAAAGGAP